MPIPRADAPFEPLASGAPPNPFLPSEGLPPPLSGELNPYQAPAAFDAPFDRAGDYRALGIASRWKRLGAAIIDGLLYMAAMTPGMFYIISLPEQPNGPDEYTESVALYGGLVAMALVQSLLITLTGQTPGKMLVGTRIVRIEDGALPGFVRGVILRFVLPYIAGLLCGLFQLIDTLWIFGEARRCLHDEFARTIVVNSR